MRGCRDTERAAGSDSESARDAAIHGVHRCIAQVNAPTREFARLAASTDNTRS
jgi:hypothetical protein